MKKLNFSFVFLLLFSACGQIIGHTELISSSSGSGSNSSSQKCEGGPTVFSTNMNARLVIGQSDFVSNLANRGGSAAANTLNNPIGIYIESGKLYIADAGNNRVLVYNTIPSANGVSADVVVGQPDFTTATSGASSTKMAGVQSIAVGSGYLAVAEWTNSRVSLWPLSNLTAATVFWGQPDSTSSTANNGGLSATSLANAAGLSYYNGNFYVGDSSNNRVLEFSASNPQTNQAASKVIGQANFTSNSVGSGLTGFGSPYALSSISGKLAVMDNYSNRIMMYNSMPSSNNPTADFTWGGYAITASGLNDPVGVFLASDRLFIADRSSDRILVFNSIPTTINQPADVVLGQSIFTSQDHNQCNCSTAGANTLWGVHHIYWDGCRLYVTDKQNNRVLVY